MKTLLALGAGALAMYLMDRERGPQRRAQLRDQVERAKRAFSARVRGVAADAESDAERVSENFPEGRALGALGKARARGRARVLLSNYLPSRSASPGMARSTRFQAAREACLAFSHPSFEEPFVRLYVASRSRSASSNLRSAC